MGQTNKHPIGGWMDGWMKEFFNIFFSFFFRYLDRISSAQLRSPFLVVSIRQQVAFRLVRLGMMSGYVYHVRIFFYFPHGPSYETRDELVTMVVVS